MSSVIPPMTDPLGAYWHQPRVEEVLVDDKYALVTRYNFSLLKDYSRSMPSGVYVGKMWKAHVPSRPWPRPRNGYWLLRWYGECEDPKYVSNNQRILLVV